MKISIQQLSNLVKKAKSEPTAEDLMKRPCCGSGCMNCPYSPKHKKGNTKVREELKKEAKIAKDKKSGKWILYTKDGSRILGKHENAQDAYKQEYAIQKSMEKKANPQKGSCPRFSKQAEDGGPKSDQEVSIITKPNKTPRNGFIRDPKTNRLMVQDRRFNLVQPKEEVIKAANKNIPAHVLKAVLNNDTKALSLFGKLGNKAKLDSKKSKAIMDAIKMEKHIAHPDTQHFLSILDKENRLI